MILYAVDAPHFYAGMLSDGYEIVAAAPILGWAIGKPESYVLPYIVRKGWTWQIAMRSDE